ncbi:hypothetical protein VIS19158_11214, partial [Vibrio scophthalmi LMG 19158]
GITNVSRASVNVRAILDWKGEMLRIVAGEEQECVELRVEKRSFGI